MGGREKEPARVSERELVRGREKELPVVRRAGTGGHPAKMLTSAGLTEEDWRINF